VTHAGTSQVWRLRAPAGAIPAEIARHDACWGSTDWKAAMKSNAEEPRAPEIDGPAGGAPSGARPAAPQPGHGLFELLVDSVKDYAIFMLDPRGCVLTWNTGAEHLKGYTFGEIVGRHFSIFYTEEDIAAGKPARELAVAESEGRYEEEGLRVRKDGGLFWASVVITAVRSAAGELVGFAKVTRDLTERRRGEEERLRLAGAREALRLRDEFLSIASHELRTPLTALELGMHRLLDDHGLPDRIVRQLSRARRITAQLAHLVDALLDVSRLSTGKLSLDVEGFDLRAALCEVVENLTAGAENGSPPIHVRAGEPIEGRWDRMRVEQVLTNLVANALKYGGSRPITVEAGVEGAGALVRVIDQGSGIAPEDLERIFGRFERAVSMENFGGLGLGLYIVRQIAEAHGGTIGVESELGKGATFTLRLPLTHRVAAEAKEEPQGSP
jgi:PAS domain S-box-containing protein